MDIVQIISGVLSAVLTIAPVALLKSLRTTRKTYGTMQEAQRSLIKARIVQTHDSSCEKGYIGKYTLETAEDLFEQYTALGGNSFIVKMMEEIRKLPIK